MGDPESRTGEIFNETEMERLTALEGRHCVLYGQVTWCVTVTIFSPAFFTFVLTPMDSKRHDRYPIAFYHNKDTDDLRFTAGDKRDLSFVRAFLNGYILCDHDSDSSAI